MGSTNKTTNLELSQFLGTDKPSWLNDYNADMLAIDSAVGTNVTDISTAQSRADSAYTLAENTASSVSALSTQVSSNTTDIATAQGNITTINSLIGNGTPTTTDQTIIGAINEINAAYQPKAYTRQVLGTNVTAGASLDFDYSDYNEVQLYVRTGGAIFTFNIDTTLTTSRTYTTGGYANATNNACCYATVSGGNSIAITQYLNGSSGAIDEVWVRYR